MVFFDAGRRWTEKMMRIDQTRDPERYVMAWPGCPAGLSKDQARNWFIQHKKPKTYVMERFYYNPKTGHAETIGYDKPCR
jgi:hypothetical protein